MQTFKQCSLLVQKLLCQFASGSLHPCLCDSVILLATGEILLSDSLTGTCTHRLGRHPLSQWPRPKVCLDNPWHPEGLSGWELLNFKALQFTEHGFQGSGVLHLGCFLQVLL